MKVAYPAFLFKRPKPKGPGRVTSGKLMRVHEPVDGAPLGAWPCRPTWGRKALRPYRYRSRAAPADKGLKPLVYTGLLVGRGGRRVNAAL